MPDFANDDNWLVVYDQLTIGTIIDALTYQPINPILLPNSLDYAFLRVTANNQNARAYWRLGAWIDFLVDDDLPQVEVERVLAPVNKPRIIYKPEILETYRLKATIPYYFDEISLRIEGYRQQDRQTIKINCGGDAAQDWIADTYFQGGQVYVYSQNGLANPLPPSGDFPPIFGDERSAASFTYSIPDLQSGNYRLKLYFNESGFSNVGQRVFRVLANQVVILGSFDIYQEIGKDKVLVKEFPLFLNGSLVLSFEGIVENAQVNAIEVIPV